MPAATARTLAVQLLSKHLQIAAFNGRVFEHYLECPLEPPAATAAALAPLLAPGLPAPRIVAASIPLGRILSRVEADPTSRQLDIADLQGLAAGFHLPFETPPTVAACGASGAWPPLPANQPWLLAAATTQADDRARLAALGLPPGRLADSTFAQLGAIFQSPASAAAPVLVWDLGPIRSHLVLLGRQGVIAVEPCPLSFNEVLAAIQTELGLRFRAAAGKLFSTGTYDFSEAGPLIAAKLAPALRQAIAKLPTRPDRLHLTGLNHDQTWLIFALADALELTPWTPDWKALARSCDVSFAPSLSTAALPTSAASLMLLSDERAPWLPAWSDEVRAAVPAPLPDVLPAAGSIARTVVSTGLAAIPAPATRPAVSTSRPATPPPAAARPVKVAPVAPRSPAAAPVAPVAAPAPVSAPAAPAASPARSRAPLYAGIAAALALLLGGGAFVLHQRSEAAVAQAVLAQKIAAETAAREDASRRAAEAEAQVAAERAAARLRDQEEKARLAARARRDSEVAALARAPGRLALRTVPAGAAVSLAGNPAVVTPVTIDDLPPGEHRLTLTLANHEPLTITATVRGSQLTDVGELALTPKPGVVEIADFPGVHYELRPATALFAPALQTGGAPATLAGLAPGDYSIVFKREGWQPRTVRLSVGPGATVRAEPDYRTGRVAVRSTPAGATVTSEGVKLGVTPPFLDEREAAELSLVLSLPGHEEARLGGRVEPGRILNLDTTLDALDRVVAVAELAELPKPTVRASPKLPADMLTRSGMAIVSLVVNRSGVPGNIRVEKASDNEFARLCALAVGEWRFSPGLTKAGRTAKVRVVLPFVTGTRN